MKYKIISNNIRYYRTLNNLTQLDLANLVNVRRETISRLEDNKYNPSFILAYSIADVLNIYDLNDLFMIVKY